MLKTTSEVLTIIRKIMAKEDLKTQHKVLLDLPPQFCNYYNESRMYNENECSWLEKTTLATLGIIEGNALYNKERVKVVSQKQQTESTNLLDRTQFRLYQSYDEISYWLIDERCIAGCKRISILDGKLYEATIDIPRADKDPSLTTDGKWIVIDEEV